MTDKRNEMPKYTLDDDGDYEWVVDPETGEGMSPQKICDLLNTPAAIPAADLETLRGVRDLSKLQRWYHDEEYKCMSENDGDGGYFNVEDVKKHLLALERILK